MLTKEYINQLKNKNDNALSNLIKTQNDVKSINYILENYSTIYSENYNILHIAPEKNIKEKFDGKNPNYITGDIQFGKANQIVDLTDMKSQFDDNFFDYIICSHVLQDIVNEKDAFSEIKRVLKKY